MKLPSGNLNLPQVGKKGDEMEVVGVNYLIKQGYQIIHGDNIGRLGKRKKLLEGIRIGEIGWEDMDKHWDRIVSLRKKLGIVTRQDYGLYDCLCKKGKQYFVFEIKYKIWKENRQHFNSSERQIWQYNRIQKKGKAKVKVLTIIEKDQKLSYHIYDWDDFEKTKTTIKLKR